MPRRNRNGRKRHPRSDHAIIPGNMEELVSSPFERDDASKNTSHESDADIHDTYEQNCAASMGSESSTATSSQSPNGGSKSSGFPWVALMMIAMATFMILGIIYHTKAIKLHREAEILMAEAEVSIREAEIARNNAVASEIINQLSNTKYGLINWTDTDNEELLFACTGISVYGPYSSDFQQTWYTRIDNKTTFYEVGSYEEVGSQRIYNHYQTSNGYDYIDTFQMIEIDENIYSLSGSYANTGSSYDRLSGSTIYNDFPIRLYCLTGRNSFLESDSIDISYDDDCVLRYSGEETAPCDCSSCCCEICTCNS